MAARQKWAGGRVRTKIGFREDLGILVRSEWEAVVLRWLNKKGVGWTYEPYAFHFPVKRGVRVYTPDVLLSGSNLLLEIKGYAKDQDRIKIKRLKIHHPKDFARLRYITKNPNSQATKIFSDLGVPPYAYYDDIVKEMKEK
jgi:hypothetical protein